MDEPSSALSRVEIDNLYSLVNVLRKNGIAIIYITHKLDEVFALADRATILRDGRVAGTFGIDELDMTLLVESMTGKSVGGSATREATWERSGANILEVTGFGVEGLFDDLSFAVGKGDIVGIAGVIGAGKSELARAIVGALPEQALVRGKMVFDDVPVEVGTMTPNKARRLGVGFVSEDRQAEGIVQEQSVQFNIILPALQRVTTGFMVVGRIARALALAVMDTVGLRPRDPTKLVRLLSGGNQQKVVIGKWLAARSKLLILDEPTRGIDVGARAEIYQVMRRQARANGLGVLLLSSDMREILVACDRILVMVRGQLTREVAPHEVTERELLDMVLPQQFDPGKEARSALSGAG
jgi:ABC-type sugar transport system ATPase subunit